ncbi:MAG: hypothetical protein ACJAR1_000735 [Rubritalea sp.]|jgi:hypothetical protein
MRMNCKTTLALSILSLCMGCGFVVAAEEKKPVPGLVATFRDDSQTVSRIVQLPELGLAASESPHPAIKPVFTAEYEGKLLIKQPGTYKFDFKGTVSINGKIETGAVAMVGGYHQLHLSYKRPQGLVAEGFSWESEYFIKEPVPPMALWHDKGQATDKNPAGNHPSPPLRIERAMTQMKCVSCHDTNFLGTMHHKFAPDALMIHIRHANTMKWYGAMTGPLFKKDDTLVQLVKDLQKLPRPERRHKPTKGEAKGLQMIGTKTGLACIACHDIKHHKTAAESKGPNLAYMTRRVSYDWFVRWMNNPQRLKPGVPMPAFFAAQKPAERDANIDALWDYLLQKEKMPLPKELRVDPNQFILQPKDRPLVNRVYIRLPDKRELLRAICVGLPSGVSYCFDAETCQLVYVWTEGYLDMAPHWKNQSGFPTPPVGKKFYLPKLSEGLRIGSQKPAYRGYQLVDGVPQFEFTYGKTSVKMRIDATTEGELRQTYQIAGRTDPIRFVGPPAGAPVSTKASTGKWTKNILTITNKEDVSLVLTYSKGDKQ